MEVSSCGSRWMHVPSIVPRGQSDYSGVPKEPYHQSTGLGEWLRWIHLSKRFHLSYIRDKQEQKGTRQQSRIPDVHAGPSKISFPNQCRKATAKANIHKGMVTGTMSGMSMPVANTHFCSLMTALLWQPQYPVPLRTIRPTAGALVRIHTKNLKIPT